MSPLLDEALRKAAVGAVLGWTAGVLGALLLGDTRLLETGLAGSVVGFVSGLVEPYLEQLVGLR